MLSPTRASNSARSNVATLRWPQPRLARVGQNRALPAGRRALPNARRQLRETTRSYAALVRARIPPAGTPLFNVAPAIFLVTGFCT
jgi:hypothetical protein